MGKIIRNGIEYSGTYDSATSVNYDNYVSGLNANSVQEGIDELADGLKNTSVVDNLLSTSTTLPLSANQGRILNEKGVVLTLPSPSSVKTIAEHTVPYNSNEYLAMGFSAKYITISGSIQWYTNLPIIQVIHSGNIITLYIDSDIEGYCNTEIKIYLIKL